MFACAALDDVLVERRGNDGMKVLVTSLKIMCMCVICMSVLRNIIKLGFMFSLYLYSSICMWVSWACVKICVFLCGCSKWGGSGVFSFLCMIMCQLYTFVVLFYVFFVIICTNFVSFTSVFGRWWIHVEFELCNVWGMTKKVEIVWLETIVNIWP